MKTLFLRLLVCIFFFGFSLYSYIEKQNQVTELKFRLPRIAKEIKAIREENSRLQYEVSRFENPNHLIELAKAFPHLKHPYLQEIVTVKEAIALNLEEPSEEVYSEPKPKVSLAKAP